MAMSLFSFIIKGTTLILFKNATLLVSPLFLKPITCKNIRNNSVSIIHIIHEKANKILFFSQVAKPTN